MHAQMGRETAGSKELIPAGAVTLGVEYCLLSGREKGLCIHIYRNALPGQEKELLCFDCFVVHPHYHYRNAALCKNERLELDCTAEGDPLRWPLNKIQHRLPAMLLRCEVEDIAREID